jgi:urease gamma subunit
MAKKPVQEESKVQQDANKEWLTTQFNYAANMEQIAIIQERVQERFKDGTLVKELEKSVRASGVVSEDRVSSGILLAMYMHTSFEVGKETGLHDLSTLVDEVFDNRDAEQPKQENT